MTRAVWTIAAVLVGTVAFTVASAQGQAVVAQYHAPAADARPLFATPGMALALVRKLGAAWQGPAREVDERMGSLVMKRYYFSSDKRFLRVNLAPDGSVLEFFLYVGQTKREVTSNRCALLPTPAETARILLSVVDPRHDPADENPVTGAAMLGWQPLHSIQSVRAGGTRIRFSAFNNACQIFMRPMLDRDRT